MKDDQDKWRTIPCSKVGSLDKIRIKNIHQINIYIQCNQKLISNRIFKIELVKLIPKFNWKIQEP